MMKYLLICILLFSSVTFADVIVKLDANSKVIFINKRIVHTISIENKGSKDVHNVRALFFPANQLEYVESDGGAYHPKNKEEATTVRWSFNVIKAGEKIERKVVLRGIIAISRAINVVEVIANDIRINDEYGVRIQCDCSGHLSTYDIEDPIEIGAETIYVVAFRNEGTTAVTNLYLVNKIADEMEFVKAEGPTGLVYNSFKQQVEFDKYPILQPGDSLTYRIVCRAKLTGSAKNTATVFHDQSLHAIIDEEGTSIYD